MKGLILWVAVFFFLYLAITAVQMGEYPIAMAMGAISIVCLWAAPSGSANKSTSRTKSARR